MDLLVLVHNLYSFSLLKNFPGGSVETNLSANARDTGSLPSAGRSHLHAMEQLSPSAKTV